MRSADLLLKPVNLTMVFYLYIGSLRSLISIRHRFATLKVWLPSAFNCASSRRKIFSYSSIVRAFADPILPYGLMEHGSNPSTKWALKIPWLRHFHIHRGRSGRQATSWADSLKRESKPRKRNPYRYSQPLAVENGLFKIVLQLGLFSGERLCHSFLVSPWGELRIRQKVSAANHPRSTSPFLILCPSCFQQSKYCWVEQILHWQRVCWNSWDARNPWRHGSELHYSSLKARITRVLASLA